MFGKGKAQEGQWDVWTDEFANERNGEVTASENTNPTNRDGHRGCDLVGPDIPRTRAPLRRAPDRPRTRPP
jgi:hypothetical protein